jgi:hypothetical protein
MDEAAQDLGLVCHALGRTPAEVAAMSGPEYAFILSWEKWHNGAVRD